MKQHSSSVWVCLILVCSAILNTAAAPKIDPIRFTVTTSATNLKLNEEFEITITAEYLNISPGTAYVLKDANSFKLKLTLPEGFVKTGGDYHDFIGTELSPSRPKVSYKIKGKFVSSGSGMFELLRSHKNADNQSTFAAVGKISFMPQVEEKTGIEESGLRVASTGWVPYMTIAELQSGVAASAEAVVITDPLRNGLFVLDPADVSSIQDTAMTIQVTSTTKRFKRVYQEHINPKWFGAIGDGVANDAVRLTNAVTFANSKNKTLLIESGSTYLIKSTVKIYCNVEGFGTINSQNQAQVEINKTGVTIKDITLSGLNGTVISGGGFQVQFVQQITFQNVKVTGVVNQAIWAKFAANSRVLNCIIKDAKGNSADGIYFANSANVLVDGNKISGFQRAGITFEAGGSDVTSGPCIRPIITNNHVFNATAGGNQIPGGIHLENCLGAIIEGNQIENCLTDGIAINPSPLDLTKPAYDYIVANNAIINCINGVTAPGGNSIHSLNITSNTFTDCFESIVFADYKVVKIENNIFRAEAKTEVNLGSIIIATPTREAGKKTSLFIEGCVNERTLLGERVALQFTNSSGFLCDLTVQNCIGNFTVKYFPNYINGVAKFKNVTIDFSGFGSTPFAFCHVLQNEYIDCKIKFASDNVLNLSQPVTFRNCNISSDALYKLKIGYYGANYAEFQDCKINKVVLTDIIQADYQMKLVLDRNTISEYGSPGFLENVTRRLAYFGLSNNKFTSTTNPTAIPIQLGLEATDSDIGVNSYRSSLVTNMPNPHTTVPWTFSITTTTTAASKSYLNNLYGNLKGGSVISLPNITGGGHDYRKLSDDNTADWARTVWPTGATDILP
jgi:hypothetical protein